MRLKALAIAFVLIAAGCRTSTPPAARLDAFLGDLHARGLFDGAVVVGDGKQILYERGFGSANLEHGVAFTPDTPVDGASLAKTFTAALVLLLQSEGTLALDEPVQRYLPEFPYPEITLRHLLTHTSGLAVQEYEYFDKFLSPQQVRTTEVLLGVLAAERPALAGPPGSAFSYSSLGYDLAALAAAHAAKQPYPELLRQRVFAPLRIESAFARPGKLSEFPGIRTLGYHRVDGRLATNDVFDLEGFHGGSNLYISARDLHRWNASFFSSFLPRGVVDEAQEPARIAGNRSGLSWGSWYGVPSGTVFWYSGHLQGFHSEVFRNAASKRSIVYVSNNTIEPWLSKGIVRAVNDILDGRAAEPYVTPATAEVTREERSGLAGEWRMPRGEMIRIETAESRFDVVSGGVRYPIMPVGPRAFYVPGLDLVLGFVRDASDSLSRIHVATNLDGQWGERVR